VISLQRRLHLTLGLTLTLAMTALGGVMHTVIQEMAEEFVITRLVHDGESLLAAINLIPAGEIRLDEHRVAGIYQRPYSGHYFVIQVEGAAPIRSRSLWDHTLGTPSAMSPGTAHTARHPGPENQPLLLWSSGFEKQGRRLTITVAEDLSPIHGHVRRFALSFAGLALLFLLLLLVSQGVVLRRSFRFREAIRSDIRRLERGEVDQLTEAVPAEIRPLVAEVNRLLQLLGHRVERSRNALGNLAHALKGPLNLLLQLSDHPELRANPRLAAEIATHTERLRQLIERELRRARLAGTASPGHRFRPAEELLHLERLLQRQYADKRLRFTFSMVDGAAWNTDRDDMLELFGNLLDNAAKWAESEVRCTIAPGPGIRFTIEDDGPGCPPEERARLAERGVRIDESVAGHGLGLAIVRDIVQLYGGSLAFDQAPELGGLRISVQLPAGHDSAAGET